MGHVSLGEEFSAVSFSKASTTSVSDRFQRETEIATRSVPPQVWKTLDDAGWRVQLAEFVVDAAPSLRGVRPTGWPRELTWDNSDAIHLPTSKLLVLAEKRRNRAGEVVASTRVAGVLRHELGHAFDMAASRGTHRLSDSQQFTRAYELDVSRLEPADRKPLAYYLQVSRSGWQETFAEAFAVSLGGGSSDIEPQIFEADFPRVMVYVRNAIAYPLTTDSATTVQRVVPETALRRRFTRRR